MKYEDVLRINNTLDNDTAEARRPAVRLAVHLYHAGDLSVTKAQVQKYVEAAVREQRAEESAKEG